MEAKWKAGDPVVVFARPTKTQDQLTSPIKVGDIVRVTWVLTNDEPMSERAEGDPEHLYDVEPLNHSTLTDIDAASVMLERAHHRIGELTRELAESEARADEIHRARMIDHTAAMEVEASLRRQLAQAVEARVAAEARAASAEHSVSLFCNEQADWRAEQPMLTAQLAEVTKERDEARRDREEMHVRRDREIDLRKAAERALAEAQRFMTEAIREREAELARATCDSMRPTCGQEGCPQCFQAKPDPEPLKVEQRWVWWHGGKEHPLADDSIIVSIGDEIVTRTAGDHDPDTTRVEWTPVQFRKHHPRLRLPEELEPAPASPAPQQATPPAEPKTSGTT